MKKLVIAALAASTIFASPALAAPTDSTSFQVTATVPEECSIEQMSTLNFGAGSLNIVTTPGPNALTLLNSSNNPSQTIWASCNTQAQVQLSSASDGLVSASNAGNTNPEFTNQIEYRLRLQTTDGSVPNLLLITQQAGTTVQANSVGAFHDQVVISADIANGDNNLLPLAGTDYTDTATISLTAI
jgi:spore coat protein U-like protein